MFARFNKDLYCIVGVYSDSENKDVETEKCAKEAVKDVTISDDISTFKDEILKEKEDLKQEELPVTNSFENNFIENTTDSIGDAIDFNDTSVKKENLIKPDSDQETNVYKVRF